MSKTLPALPWTMPTGTGLTPRPLDFDVRGGRIDLTARFRLPLSGPDAHLADVLGGDVQRLDVAAAIDAVAAEIAEDGRVVSWQELASEMDALRARLAEMEQQAAHARQRRDEAEPHRLPDWIGDVRGAEGAARDLQDAIAILQPRVSKAEHLVQQVTQAAASACWLALRKELEAKVQALQLALVERLQGKQADGRDLLTEAATGWYALQVLRGQESQIARRLQDRLRQREPVVAAV